MNEITDEWLALLARPSPKPDMRYAIVEGTRVCLSDVKMHEVFKLYEPTGEYLGTFTAEADAFFDEEFEVHAIHCFQYSDPVKEKDNNDNNS